MRRTDVDRGRDEHRRAAILERCGRRFELELRRYRPSTEAHGGDGRVSLAQRRNRGRWGHVQLREGERSAAPAAPRGRVRLDDRSARTAGERGYDRMSFRRKRHSASAVISAAQPNADQTPFHMDDSSSVVYSARHSSQ